MIINLNGLRVAPLGDPHLGKKFVNGVPLHRRGEREGMQWAAFEAHLDTECDVHVTMGDLFDKAVVPLAVILRAYHAYMAAARRNRDTTYVILMGNHDGARDADFRSAFDVLTELIGDHDQICVAREEAATLSRPKFENVTLGFCPWHPFKTAAEIIATLPDNVDAVFGHWDLISFTKDAHNYLPVEWLQARPHIQVFTGHDHKRRTEVVERVPVEVVGSMQPYAHGEDAENSLDPMYLTLTLDQLDDRDLTDKCVRLDLRPGEDVPELDCLQLQVRRVKETGEPEELSVEFEAFDMMGLFASVFAEAGVPEDIGQQLMARYQDTRLQEVE